MCYEAKVPTDSILSMAQVADVPVDHTYPCIARGQETCRTEKARYQAGRPIGEYAYGALREEGETSSPRRRSAELGLG